MSKSKAEVKVRVKAKVKVKVIIQISSSWSYFFSFFKHCPLYNLHILHINYWLLAFMVGLVFNIIFISIYPVSLF